VNSLTGSALENASVQENVVLAGKALQADISPRFYQLLRIATAGMLFTETDDIAEIDIHHF